MRSSPSSLSQADFGGDTLYTPKDSVVNMEDVEILEDTGLVSEERFVLPRITVGPVIGRIRPYTRNCDCCCPVRGH